MDAFCLEILNQSAISLHAQFNFFYDILGRNVAGSEGEDDFSFGVMRERHDFFGFPSDAIVLERVSRGDTLAIHDHELFV